MFLNIYADLKLAQGLKLNPYPADAILKECLSIRMVRSHNVTYQMVRHRRVCHKMVRHLTVQHHKMVHATKRYVTKWYSYVTVDVT